MTRLTTAVLGAALAFAPVAAHAHSWTIFNALKDECVPAATFAEQMGVPQFANPAGARAAFRMTTGYRGTKIVRDDEGKIEVVEISFKPPFNGRKITMMFFSSASVCEIARIRAEKAGVVINPRDLR